jgi:prefoldin subunit 5
MDSFDSQEIVDAIDQLRSAIESLEMRLSSLESSAGRGSGSSGGAIEQRLDQINRTVEAIRKEMF